MTDVRASIPMKPSLLLCPICGDLMAYYDHPQPPDFTVVVVCHKDYQAFRLTLPRVEVTPVPYEDR